MVILNLTAALGQDSLKFNKADSVEVHFKKLYSVQQQYLHWIDKRNMEFPFGVPAIAYNQYDGLQVGAALINLKQPVKHIDFTASLLYGIKSKKVNGTANVDYYIRPKKSVLSEIKPGVRFQSFTYYDFVKPLKYYAIAPELVLTFNHRSEKLQKLEHRLSFTNHTILKNDPYSSKDSIDKYYVNILKYRFTRNDNNFPFSATFSLEQTNSFVKTYFEANSFIRYQLKDYKTGVHLRMFIGGFLWRENKFFFQDLTYAEYGFSMNGKTGAQDYYYNDFYVARTEQDGFGSRQISQTDGFLKTVASTTIIGQTPNWLMAMNVKIDFPIQYVPLKLFFDLGYSYNNKYGNGSPLPVKGLQFDGGFMLSFLDEGFEIYFPVFYSKEYKSYYRSNAPKFKQRISFLLDLHKLELHKKIREMKF